MGRHSEELNPLNWPRRVAITMSVILALFLGMTPALAPGLFTWLTGEGRTVIAIPQMGWGEVVADKPDKPGTPPDLAGPSILVVG